MDEDLSKNPFSALFPSIEHAKDYIRSTKTTIREEQNSSQVHQFQEGSSDESADIGKIINDFLQRSLLLTINPDEKQSSWRSYGLSLPNSVLLEGLYEELKENKQPLLLHADNINQAIMERLSLTHPSLVKYREQSSPLDYASPAEEPALIKYLAFSLQRLREEEQVFQRKAKDSYILEKIAEVRLSCESLLTTYAGSILLSPEVFSVSKPQQQLFHLLMKPHECKYLSEFVDAIVGQQNDFDELSEIFLPVVNLLMSEIRLASLMNPSIFTILHIILYFSKNPQLAAVLVSSEHWLKPASTSSTAGLDFEQSTLLGPLLGTTTLSNDPITPSEFFVEPSKQSQAEMEAVMNNCRKQIDEISSMLHTIFRNLLENKDLQPKVLHWIGACIHHNRRRSQLSHDTGFASMLTQARDGFFLNLGNVMLKLCQPFLELSGKSKKALRINSLFCLVDANINDIARSDCPIHLVQNQEDPKIAKRPDEMPVPDVSVLKFKFVTECFFLTHKCLKVGYLKACDSYHSLMKRLQKLSQLYQDLRMDTLRSRETDMVKQEFEEKIQRQLSYKAHLLNPSLAELVLKFCSTSCYWLLQQLMADEDFNDGQHRDLVVDNLQEKVYPAMAIIPEYIVENIADCLIFLEHFGEEHIEKSSHLLENVMIFFSSFLGSSNRLNNPHLRAKLAEALAGLLPRRKNELGVISYKAGFKIFENCPLIAKILPEALLKLFVDIEYTGHSMEFEQKFGYRHHMYAVLEYIWKIPSYNKVFWDLFEEGRRYYCERSEFSAFPRFINLLLNDSTFLLDEALQHLCKIRELEKERDEADWRERAPQAREENTRNLMMTSEMARGYNIMANETVHVLCYITKDITRPFASPCMVEQTASFLNYFLLHLVGPKSKELKVQDLDKLHFKPKELVKNIAQILLNLGNEDDFCRAVVSDGRSYSPELFTRAQQVLLQLKMPQDFLDEFTMLAAKFEKLAETTKAEEDNMPEPPEEFIDPILGTLMLEPVLLPSSKKILDKSTIARHLLSDPKDPFNRSPLTLDMVEPATDLKSKIEAWMDEHGMRRTNQFSSKNCSG